MITTIDLEKRLNRFFKAIFAQNAIEFGFSTEVEERYIVANQTSAPRPTVKTALYYYIEYIRPFGNSVASYSEKYDRPDAADIVYPYNEVKVVVNIVSKDHGSAKTAMQFFRAAIQSERKTLACYDNTQFKLPLHRMEDYDRILTELENGAWNERIETDLYFNYSDAIEIDPMEFTQEPETIEDVPDIIQSQVILKD